MEGDGWGTKLFSIERWGDCQRKFFSKFLNVSVATKF